jgi:GAF domain-containing protein
VREVFAAEGCSLLLLDPARREFHFLVVSESDALRAAEARLAQIRFPADRGVAGWSVAHDQAVLVNDAPSDPRFYRGVDDATSVTTRAILCAPLRTRSGPIGVIEVINPCRGPFTQQDLEFLEVLASDIAVAEEKALLYEQLRAEVVSLRRAYGIAGICVIAAGMLVSLGGVIAHLALALPLSELATHPGLWAGLLITAVGVGLVGLARGWFAPRTRRLTGASAPR